MLCRRVVSWCIAVVGLIFCVVAVAIPTPKPRSPISVTIVAAQAVAVGRPVDFHVRIASAIDAADIKVSVQHASTVVVHSDTLVWSGHIAAGGTYDFLINATLTEIDRAYISVRAVLQQSTGTQFSAQVEFRPALGGGASLHAALAGKSIVRMRNGRAIAEFSLK